MKTLQVAAIGGKCGKSSTETVCEAFVAEQDETNKRLTCQLESSSVVKNMLSWMGTRNKSRLLRSEPVKIKYGEAEF
jgi:hypothetical protein